MCIFLASQYVQFLQGAMKTAKYRKRCFDQIEGIVTENKALTAEVDRLRSKAEEKVADTVAQEERLLDLNRQLADKDWEKKGKSWLPSSCS
jgi:regulator of replication initiation timing